MKIKDIAFGIIIALTILGIMIATNAVHELSHKYDFRNIAFDEHISLLVIPCKNNDYAIAIYNFSTYAKDLDEYNRISVYTEKKAFILSTIFFILASIAIILVLINRWRKKK